jgi:hypothetical protein
VAKLSISDVILAPTSYKGTFVCRLPKMLFSGIFTVLIFLLQCYSKYGEVVQGLTRFFRDKASSDPLTLEPTDCNSKSGFEYCDELLFLEKSSVLVNDTCPAVNMVFFHSLCVSWHIDAS